MKVKNIIGKSLIGGVLLLGFVAYYFGCHDASIKVSFDGLGRQVYETPSLVSFFIGQEWPGLYWFVIDLFVFWGGIILGLKLIEEPKKVPPLNKKGAT